MTGDWKKPDVGATVGASEGEVFSHHQASITNHLLTIDLGLIGYSEAYELQKRLVSAVKASAASFTSHQSTVINDEPPVTSHFLLLCEHQHVITLGRNGRREHVLVSDGVLRQKGVEFHATDRGGDVTYHGPGQVVGYPILNLAAIRRDVGWYVRMLEETMIGATADYGITAEREPGKTGIWVPSATEADVAAEKLGAIGVHLSRWVTSHGFAYNVSTDLRYFDLIGPCGIAGRKATSIEKLLGRGVDRAEAAARLTKYFGEVFNLETQPASRDELFEILQRFEQPVAVPA